MHLITAMVTVTVSDKVAAIQVVVEVTVVSLEMIVVLVEVAALGGNKAGKHYLFLKNKKN